MTITIKFFASLREQIGQSEIHIEIAKPLTAAQIWAQVCNNVPLPTNILISINLEYTDQNALVQDGDELAFFPPVTGG